MRLRYVAMWTLSSSRGAKRTSFLTLVRTAANRIHHSSLSRRDSTLMLAPARRTEHGQARSARSAAARDAYDATMACRLAAGPDALVRCPWGRPSRGTPCDRMQPGVRRHTAVADGWYETVTMTNSIQHDARCFRHSPVIAKVYCRNQRQARSLTSSLMSQTRCPSHNDAGPRSAASAAVASCLPGH